VATGLGPGIGLHTAWQNFSVRGPHFSVRRHAQRHCTVNCN